MEGTTEFGRHLIGAMKEAVAHARGEDVGAIVHVVKVPVIDVKSTREKLDMTQQEFAQAFGFNVHTLRNWEQGRRRPEKPTRILLAMIDREPETVRRVLSDIDEDAREAVNRP